MVSVIIVVVKHSTLHASQVGIESHQHDWTSLSDCTFRYLNLAEGLVEMASNNARGPGIIRSGRHPRSRSRSAVIFSGFQALRHQAILLSRSLRQAVEMTLRFTPSLPFGLLARIFTGILWMSFLLNPSFICFSHFFSNPLYISLSLPTPKGANIFEVGRGL